MVKATVVGDITVHTKKVTSGFKSPITSCFRTIAITRTGPPPPFTHTPPFTPNNKPPFHYYKTIQTLSRFISQSLLFFLRIRCSICIHFLALCSSLTLCLRLIPLSVSLTHSLYLDHIVVSLFRTLMTTTAIKYKLFCRISYHHGFSVMTILYITHQKVNT